jgi:putative tryptophan/tyrosine transport system substrate-binding protein
MITRREFAAGVAVGVLASPFIAGAQQTGRIYRIGYLATPVPPPKGPFFGGFVPAMRDLGYIEGQNLAIEIRSAHEKPERLLALAARTCAPQG